MPYFPIVPEVTTLNNYVIVQNLSHLPDPVGDVITVSNNSYQINGNVDISPNRLVIEEGVFIFGLDFNVDSLSTNNAGALFTSSASFVTIQNLFCENPHATGSLFNFTGTGTEGWIIQEVLSITTPFIGAFGSYGNLVIQNCGFFFFTTGLTFTGSNNGNSSFATTLLTGFTGVAIDLGTAIMNSMKFLNLTWEGSGGSSTDISGLVNSGNIATNGLAIVTDGTFSLTGTKLNNIDSSDLRWEFLANQGIMDSTVSAAVSVIGSGATTIIPAANARVLMNVTGVVGEEVSRITIASDGVSTYIGIGEVRVLLDGNLLVEPSSSTKDLACQFTIIKPATTVVTFTNATNLINDTGTTLVNGDNVSFKDNAGTLPAALFNNVIYFVVNQLTNSYQVAYTDGGTAILLPDDGSGTNSYRKAELHGSIPTNAIAANSPRNLVPQGLVNIETGDEITTAQINRQDSINIDVKDVYYRITK